MAEFDIFSSTSITEALNNRLPAKRFLAKTFFTPRIWSTSTVLLDTVDGGRSLAPFIRPEQAGSTIKGLNITAKAFTPAQINIHTRTSAVEAFKRAAGEKVTYASGEARSAEAAFGEQIARDQEALLDSAYRTIERMCSEALFGGKVNLYDEAGSIIDFVDEGIKNSHNVTLSGAKAWNASSTDPIADLRAWKRLVAKDSGLTARDVVMGSNAYDSFIQNESVQNYLDKRHLNLGDVTPNFDLEEDGATYMGSVEGLKIWVYDEWYNDPATKTDAPVVPADKVCVLSRNLRAETHYAKVQDVDAGDVIGEFFSRIYSEPDGSARYVQLRSAPLSVVEQIDGLVVASVVA